LLYAATDTQIWFSIDDGDHWNSLRLDMPAISVRDIQVKDDESCLCSDLVAGTHGRGFWILDNVTPLRQAADAAAASKAHLFKPATGIRIRFGTNDPTPWPPELLAGENPAPGALLDYYLPAGVSEAKLEFFDAQGHVLRTYSSKDAVRNPDPALDPVAYNKLCQKTPNAPDCAVPLYWPAPPQSVKTSAGMHRFSWDLHYDPIPGTPGGRGGSVAVPHRIYPNVNSPWVSPGVYTVRLTADGETVSQSITIKLDPRVKVTPAVQQIFTLTAQMENNARIAASAYKEARSLLEEVKAKPVVNQDLVKKLEEIAPIVEPPAAGGGEFPGFGVPPPPAPSTLANVAGQLIGSIMPMQGAEMPPTAAQLAACKKQDAAYSALMAKWTALKAQAK